jgi:hypothetical protein
LERRYKVAAMKNSIARKSVTSVTSSTKTQSGVCCNQSSRPMDTPRPPIANATIADLPKNPRPKIHPTRLGGRSTVSHESAPSTALSKSAAIPITSSANSPIPFIPIAPCASTSIGRVYASQRRGSLIRWGGIAAFARVLVCYRPPCRPNDAG